MKSKIFTVLCVLIGLLYLNSGLNKYLNYMPMPSDLPDNMKSLMKSMMDISWLMPLVGAVEIIGGILFAIPKFRAIGNLMLIPIFVGIAIVHLTVAPSGLPIVAVLLIIHVWSMYEDRNRYLGLLG